MLRKYCVLCGGHFHPAALGPHQLQAHPDTCRWASQIAFQLIAVFQTVQPNDHSCALCGLIFNTPITPDADHAARLELMQTHLAWNCPIVQQVALLLHPQHGPHNDLGRVRSGAAGQLPGLEPFAQTGQRIQKIKRRRTPDQAPQAGGQGSLGKNRRVGTRIGRPDGSSSIGPTGSEPRTGTAEPGQTRLFRYVHQQQPTRSPAPAGHSGGCVEEVSEHRTEYTAQTDTADTTSTGPHQGVVTESPETQRLQSGRYALGHCSPEGHDQRGWLVAVHEMEPGRTKADPSEQGTDTDGTAHEGPAVPGRIAGGLDSCGALPQPEAAAGDDPLVAPGQSTGLRSMATDDHACANPPHGCFWACRSKIHSQTLSRPAQAVQHLFGKGAPQTKGTGKGQKGKAKK